VSKLSKCLYIYIYIYTDFDENNINYSYIAEIDKLSYSSIIKESTVTDSNSSSRDGFNLQLDTILTETEMDQFPLFDSLERMVADNSVILAAESKVSKKVSNWCYYSAIYYVPSVLNLNNSKKYHFIQKILSEDGLFL